MTYTLTEGKGQGWGLCGLQPTHTQASLKIETTKILGIYERTFKMVRRKEASKVHIRFVSFQTQGRLKMNNVHYCVYYRDRR